MGCKQVNSKEEHNNNKVEDKSRSKPSEVNLKEENKIKNEPAQEATEYTIQMTQNCKLIWQNNFPIEMTANQVIEQFKQEKPEYKVNALTKFLINDAAELDVTKQLKELQIYTSRHHEIRFGFESIERSLLLDLLNNQKDGLDFVAKPMLNPFSLIIFSKSRKNFETYPLSDLTITDYLLNLYTQTGSYCNGGNFLFLSGGEKDGQLESHLWSINLLTKDIKVTTEPMLPKKQHSMIFINPSYVFIVGGNSKDAFFYDTSKNSFVNWGLLNVDRIEPALALIDNRYLYCFSHLKTNLSFEKTDLNEEQLWQLITPKISPGLQFTQKYFGVVIDTSSSLIFVGGCMKNDLQNRKCFKYNTQSNELDESSIDFKEVDLIEKTFVNVNNKYLCLIPNCSVNNLSVILFNNQTKTMETIGFEGQSEGQYSIKRKQLTLAQSLLVDVNQINLNMPNK